MIISWVWYSFLGEAYPPPPPPSPVKQIFLQELLVEAMVSDQNHRSAISLAETIIEAILSPSSACVGEYNKCFAVKNIHVIILTGMVALDKGHATSEFLS